MSVEEAPHAPGTLPAETDAAEGALPTAQVLDTGSLFAQLPAETRGRVEAAATPVRLPADEWLFRQGDEGDAFYVVRSGRVEVVAEHAAAPVVINVLRSGAALGELSLLTGAPRAASVRAVRDTELLRLDAGRFTELMGEPAFALALTRTLAALLQRGTATAARPLRRGGVVGVVPVHAGLPVDRLVVELTESLGAAGAVTTLWGRELDVRGTPDDVLADYGRLLDRLEQEHDHVLLVAGAPGAPDGWDRFCRRQADRAIALAWADLAPSAEASATVGGADLALITRHDGPPDVERWFVAAAPGRHHIIPTGAGFGDAVRRMGRRLTGTSLGLVLSCGGARGLAHIGVLEVLLEAGVAIDRIGGCSMGAFVGALFALGRTPDEMVEVCKTELVSRNPFNDYTIPRVSLIRAHKAEAMLRRVFGTARIEQLPVDYFSVSAEMLHAQVVVHRRGPLADAVGGSMSIPGLVPPLREAGRLLVDGGVLNNLPIDIMAGSGEGPVVAVDVMGRKLEASATRADEVPGRRFRLRRREPVGELALPNILETLSRVTVLGSWRAAAQNREHAAAIVTPELTGIGLFEFGRIDAAVEAGRRAARDALPTLTTLA
jgi:NTE family protein